MRVHCPSPHLPSPYICDIFVWNTLISTAATCINRRFAGDACCLGLVELYIFHTLTASAASGGTAVYKRGVGTPATLTTYMVTATTTAADSAILGYSVKLNPIESEFGKCLQFSSVLKVSTQTNMQAGCVERVFVVSAENKFKYNVVIILRF